MNDNLIRNLIQIIDLIEDKDFPAVRSITDYMLLLLSDLGVDGEKIKMIDTFINNEYQKRGTQDCYSQTEIKKILAKDNVGQ